jgi:hypothetical protein
LATKDHKELKDLFGVGLPCRPVPEEEEDEEDGMTGDE